MTKKSFLAEFEEEMLKVWEKEQTFIKSVQARRGKKRFSFYDGPPYANGLPHHGHVVPSAIKDAVARYKTMQGYYVPRRLGWDTHGLPVEYQIEKEMGFKSRKDILEYGVDKFNKAARDSVFRYKKEWENFIKRMGRWADAENAYATLDDSYIESVWWAFAEIYKKGLIHQDYRSTPYCPRCATPLSNFELNQGYKDNVKDPSVFIKFELKGEDAYLVAWTTTPWTLPGNAALGIDKGESYVKVKYGKDTLILAKKRLEVLAGEYKKLDEFKGAKLAGKEYKPLFNLDLEGKKTKNLYKVWGVDFADMKEGSGIVHIAPAFGEDDLATGKKYDIGILKTIDTNGNVATGWGLDELEGLFFKTADEQIIGRLTKEGYVLSAETFNHTYPFCWRCDTPLIYYAVRGWFMNVPKFKRKLLANNQKIKWVPKHIGAGRFGNWLAEVKQWSISRTRFWGAPLPVWQCNNGHACVVGSIAELKKLAVNAPDKIDLHKPAIDKILLKCPHCKGEAKRVEEVFDVWFEAGSMPYAQDNYPFSNKDKFESGFPADFISESIDQTRGWFYTLHVLASALFDKPAAKNIVVSGWVVAADGQKLSKRLKNYAPLDEVFDNFGADSLRYFMLTSPVTTGEDVKFRTNDLRDVQRNVFMTLWNTYNFYKTYTVGGKWHPTSELRAPSSDNLLDKWILARLNQTIDEVTKNADKYQLVTAVRPLAEFIDDLSNWYLRRSRRRFNRAVDKRDQTAAFATLHHVIIRTCQLMAPWAPFLSDKIYREIKSNSMPKSVHLTDWPKAGKVDHSSLSYMKQVKLHVEDALKQRAEAGIRIRQPLTKVTIAGDKKHPMSKTDLQQILKDEVNVKEVVLDPNIKTETLLDIEISHELKLEGMAREVIRHVQVFRKELKLSPADKIVLSLAAEGELKQALDAFSDLIAEETNAKELKITKTLENAKPAAVDGQKLGIGIARAK